MRQIRPMPENFSDGMCERCESSALGNEWICSDPYVQKDHAEDPFDAFTKPNVESFSLLFHSDDACNHRKRVGLKKYLLSLPFYNIGGDQDPVGNYGQGLYEVSNWLHDTGIRFRRKVYPGYRHEIHNYADIRCDVEQGIIDFMDSLI